MWQRLDLRDWNVTLTPRTREAAIAQFRSLPTSVLARILTADRTHLRCAAAILLGYRREPEAITPLLRALGDPKAEVRASAVWALGGLRDSSVIPALLQTLDDPEDAVVAASARALAKTEEPDVIPALEALLVHLESSEVRAAAAQAIEALRRRGQQERSET